MARLLPHFETRIRRSYRQVVSISIIRRGGQARTRDHWQCVRVRFLQSSASPAACAKRIDDPQSPVDGHPILHVLGPQPVALGEKGRSGDESVIDAEMMSFG